MGARMRTRDNIIKTLIQRKEYVLKSIQDYNEELKDIDDTLKLLRD